MAKVIVGGVDYIVPELNFIALELSWPHIELAQVTQHPMDGTAAAIMVIAAGLAEADPFDPSKYGIDTKEYAVLSDVERMETVARFLKKKLKATELDGVRSGMLDITKEAGLVSETGEDDPPTEEMLNPSTETAPASLPNLSPPDAREAAGTA